MDREYADPLDVPATVRAPDVALTRRTPVPRRVRRDALQLPNDRHIERAKALLRCSDRTVNEACMEVGCTSLGSFSARSTTE
jgi:AraC-like DNA-binding protein